MALRSKIFSLPQQQREEVDAWLVGHGFAGYDDLAALLAEKGYEISRSSLHRYGQKLERSIEAIRRVTEQAEAIASNTPDDEGALLEATQRLIQQQLFEAMLDFQLNAKDIGVKEFIRIIQAQPGLSNSLVRLKNYQEEVRHRIEAAKEEVRAVGGISSEAMDKIDRILMGIG